jgi:hypothetical protein
MKKILVSLLLVVCCYGLRAQDSLRATCWTDGTALNISKHRWELGLFTASRYGLTKNLELSAHPLMFFLMPQVKLKVGWGNFSGFHLATEHGIFYPTMAMRLVAAKGTGGLISPEFTIPQMFSVANRLLVSYQPFRASMLTVHGGIAFAIKFGPLDPRTTIDMPLIYPRLAVFYNQPEFDAGIDFRGQFIPRLGWLFNVENFIVCGTEQNYFMENKGVLAYTSKKQSLRIEAGYKLCFGRYPAGPQWHLLPVLDIVFGIGK